jgi:DNA-binding response OmpR family regulator
MQLHACGSVAQARAWLDAHGAPDLLLTDLMLPDETGLEFISALRAGADWQQTLPVLVMTAGVQPESMQQLASLDVCQVLIKPLAIDALRDAVRGALQARLSIPARTAVDTRFGGDTAMFETFRDAALAQFPVDSRQIDEALARADAGALERGARRRGQRGGAAAGVGGPGAAHRRRDRNLGRAARVAGLVRAQPGR